MVGFNMASFKYGLSAFTLADTLSSRCSHRASTEQNEERRQGETHSGRKSTRSGSMHSVCRPRMHTEWGQSGSPVTIWPGSFSKVKIWPETDVEKIHIEIKTMGS